MMVQKDVSLVCVCAWVGWTLATLLAIGDMVSPPEVRLLGPAFLFAAAGGILHVRSMIHGLERREQEAFQLGRESVSQLRR